jgi:hypothetical protein
MFYLGIGFNQSVDGEGICPEQCECKWRSEVGHNLTGMLLACTWGRAVFSIHNSFCCWPFKKERTD